MSSLLWILCSDEDGSKHFLVDFEQKTLTAQAERRRQAQQHTASEGMTDDQHEDKEQELDKEDELDDDPDKQWSLLFSTVSACYSLSLKWISEWVGFNVPINTL